VAKGRTSRSVQAKVRAPRVSAFALLVHGVPTQSSDAIKRAGADLLAVSTPMAKTTSRPDRHIEFDRKVT